MPTSCNTHDYDGQLRAKWFEMRPILLEKYFKNCLSFDDTISDIEQWLETKYFNVKRIGRARRSLKILKSQRDTNFDRRNDIDVEELLPILWHQVKTEEDIHDTFYEQLCDITGGSCSQGRSTRLFQFLFILDCPISPLTNSSEQTNSAHVHNSSTELDPSTSTVEQNEQPVEKTTSSQSDHRVDEEQQNFETANQNPPVLPFISDINRN